MLIFYVVFNATAIVFGVLCVRSPFVTARRLMLVGLAPAKILGADPLLLPFVKGTAVEYLYHNKDEMATEPKAGARYWRQQRTFVRVFGGLVAAFGVLLLALPIAELL